MATSRRPARRRAPAQKQIEGMFDDIVERYDLLNALMSLGMDRGWRRATANAVAVAPGDRVLDLGCGTGRLGERLAARSRVVGVDVSANMLRRARRLHPGSMVFVQGSAFNLPFATATFAAAVSGFVLRNLDDLDRAFAELARVVRPGGRIAMVDATEPANRMFRPLFDAYLRVVAPALGSLVGKRKAYSYFARSLAQIPEGKELASMLESAGFRRASARRLTGGAVTLVTAER